MDNPHFFLAAEIYSRLLAQKGTVGESDLLRYASFAIESANAFLSRYEEAEIEEEETEEWASESEDSREANSGL